MIVINAKVLDDRVKAMPPSTRSYATKDGPDADDRDEQSVDGPAEEELTDVPVNEDSSDTSDDELLLNNQHPRCLALRLAQFPGVHHTSMLPCSGSRDSLHDSACDRLP